MSQWLPGPTEPPVRTSLRLLWSVGLVYAVAAATRPGTSGRHLAASVLTAATAAGWGLWLAARHRGRAAPSLAGVVLLAATGGVMVVLHPIGVAVVGVAGLCAGSALDLVPAAVVVAPGVLAAAVAVAVSGHQAGEVVSVASGGAAGLVIGMGRRQAQQRVKQEAELALAHQRTELERDRAAVLAERNRLAREVHDVLAHTLSALSVQMEALGSLVEGRSGTEDIASVAARSRRLVTEGLEETQRAVRVLRDEPIDVADQVAALAEEEKVDVRIVGDCRPLPPATGLALVRVAQEAVTNARKHAVGAQISVTLVFDPASASVDVENNRTTASALSSTGTGYGLQGLRERLELVGGRLLSGWDGDTWRVHADVPT